MRQARPLRWPGLFFLGYGTRRPTEPPRPGPPRDAVRCPGPHRDRPDIPADHRLCATAVSERLRRRCATAGLGWLWATAVSGWLRRRCATAGFGWLWATAVSGWLRQRCATAGFGWLWATAVSGWLRQRCATAGEILRRRATMIIPLGALRLVRHVRSGSSGVDVRPSACARCAGGCGRCRSGGQPRQVNTRQHRATAPSPSRRSALTQLHRGVPTSLVTTAGAHGEPWCATRARRPLRAPERDPTTKLLGTFGVRVRARQPCLSQGTRCQQVAQVRLAGLTETPAPGRPPDLDGCAPPLSRTC
jgi:hypothetical protein